MSLEVRYLDIPEGAQQDAQASGNQGQSFSSLPQILAGTMDMAYATLEPGSWVLDGSRMLMLDRPRSMGWWSAETTDANGRFESAPEIVISFDAPYSASGMTFRFWPSMEQWCSEMEVSWYNGNSKIDFAIVYPDGPVWYLNRSVESFTKISVKLNATNYPKQFAKIQMIQIGRVIVFGRNELISVRVTNEVDPSLCVLSVDSIRVQIRDRNNRNLVPQENQRMEVYRNGELMAANYILDSKREGKNEYSFECQSVIGLLGDEYLGGMYQDAPVIDVLSDVLDGRKFDLDDAFLNAKVTGYLPVCTRREALQQIAFAIGAMVTTQFSDEIRMIPIPETESGKFTFHEIFAGADVETRQRIYKFEVVSHSYKKSDETVTLLSNETVETEEELFTFYEPHHSYSIEGGQIEDSGTNWVKITASEPVTLHAKTYVHNKVTKSKKDPKATAAERNNVLTVDSATLVHSGNVQQVLNRLYSVKKMRRTMTEEVVINGQAVGDLVSSASPWGGYMHGYLVSMESTLTQNGHTASIEILGDMN